MNIVVLSSLKIKYTDSVGNIFKYFFFLFSQETRLCHFMQIVTLGDNSHEISREKK